MTTQSAPTPKASDADRLRIDDLHVSFATDAGDVSAVRGISLSVAPGEILALVGESGSGKTVTGRSVLGLLPETAAESGAIWVNGRDVVTLKASELRQMRGADVSMIFQEPSSALNPVFPIWWQFGEGLRAHDPHLSRKEVQARTIEALRSVGIPDAERRIKQYPHEFSGGQKQRIMIAMALASGVGLIVADEPTTALDVTVQAEILQLLRQVRDTYQTSIILITHNMGVVADLADSVAVMNQGRIVERNEVHVLFHHPQDPYTRQLLAAVPRIGRASVSAGLSDADRARLDAADHVVEASDLVIEYPGRLGSKAFRAVNKVTFHISAGEVFGLVGESGSGKTTIGRTIAGLEQASAGSLRVLGHQMVGGKERDFKPLRNRLGFVFQDPATSFNPQVTLEETIAEPLVIHRRDMGRAERSRIVADMLEAVRLPASYGSRYPHELSGGQRQRASLARSLVLGPELLVADEPTSALDVSVQATVLKLFGDLQEQFGFACLFISHDLAVIDMVAHRVGVLYHGELVEQGTGDQVLNQPEHAYTKRLVASLPVPDPEEQAARRKAFQTL